MAKVYLSLVPERVPLFLVVEQAVGRACPNRRDDVLLVQVLLRAAMDGTPPRGGYRPPGERPIGVDGICGRQTIAYIDFYQEENNRRFPAAMPLATDDRIDPVRPGEVIGSISDTPYTILILNQTYSQVRGPAMMRDIRRDPNYHVDLTPSLYTGR